MNANSARRSVIAVCGQQIRSNALKLQTRRPGMGAVVQPGGLDLAPGVMHAAIKQHWEWKVQP
jgi:hypothetical protein